MKKLFAALLVVCMPMAAGAVEAPLLYSRTTVVLHLAHPASKGQAMVAIDTEIREAASAARTPGWFNFVSPSAFKGALAIYPEPNSVTINTTQDYAPFDILLIDAYGTITQILPNIVLASLEEPVTSSAPVLAVLYLRGGACAALGLTPGDSVEYKLFRKKPVVLSVPAAEEKKAMEAPAASP